MTFGYGSPGFDPLYCPPCPPGKICNVICLDPIDAPLTLGMVVVLYVSIKMYMVVGPPTV